MRNFRDRRRQAFQITENEEDINFKSIYTKIQEGTNQKGLEVSGMDTYKTISFSEAVEGNAYPGRGIVVGMTPDAGKAVAAYFIMGRSENSRNRVFTVKNGVVYTEPFDIAKLEDPSLIIYAAVRQHNNHLVVTNGNQTDTVVEDLVKGGSFYHALESRCFEPDAPNFTPRISAEIEFDEKAGFKYRMSILKSADAEGSACNRFGYDYAPIAGLGHFIHTYEHDGNPLPSFYGEPKEVEIPDDMDAFTELLWNSLNEDNKVSLFVRYIDIATGEYRTKIVNKNV